MARRILIIQGHPDSSRRHLCHALADAYAEGARGAAHMVERVEIAELDFPLLRRQEDFEGAPPDTLLPAQRALGQAEHIVLVFPLWLGAMPALTKGFMEQLLRPGFAHAARGKGFPKGLLTGHTARVVVTMGMPAPIYRCFYRAHGLKNLKRNIFGLCGIGPTRDTLFGGIEAASDKTRAGWIERMRALGAKAA